MENHFPAKKNFWPLLFLSFACFVALIYIVLTFPPQLSVSVGQVNISYLFLFFPLLFLMLYGMSGFFFKSALQGFLIASLVVVFLVFRFLNLTNPFFAILLLILFLSAEGVIWKRK